MYDGDSLLRREKVAMKELSGCLRGRLEDNSSRKNSNSCAVTDRGQMLGHMATVTTKSVVLLVGLG